MSIHGGRALPGCRASAGLSLSALALIVFALLAAGPRWGSRGAARGAGPEAMNRFASTAMEVGRLRFPLAPGTRWVYVHDYYGAGTPRHLRWTTTQVITAARATAGGVLVVQRVLRSGGTAFSGLWNYGDWLIRSHCLFAVQPSWLTSRAGLRGRIRRAFQRGDMRALACAPLRVGQSWGGQRRYFRTWVEGLGPPSIGPPRFSPWAASAFRIHWKFVQGPVQIWYRPGVGITDERYRHAGAYGRYSVTLVSFHAGDDLLPKDGPKTH